MRKLTAVIAFIIASTHGYAQSAIPNFDTTRKRVDKILGLDTLTAMDRMHFVLRVNNDKIAIVNDKNGNYNGTLSAQVTLTNYSPDTLKYMSMDCSWEDIYRSDNNGIVLYADHSRCFKNGPVEKIVPPWQSTTVTLHFIKSLKFSAANRLFRIGMRVQKAIKWQPFVALNLIRGAPANTIWSDQIEWPGAYTFTSKKL